MTNAPEMAVEVIDLGKSYGDVVALDSINLAIENGQYFVLLGPSGGGKTTLLRLLGGFVKPTRGRVLLHGKDVAHLPPNRRPTSMVFQGYALFPHMSVARNVAYGLKLRRLARDEIEQRVVDMLELVGLAGLNDRMPHELSGGQQQRVQLARALVLESDVLLLDEPLAALDAKLRQDMCLELKRIQEKVGITFLHVTHNQEEAMTIADRIAVIAGGELMEEGTPREIYEQPERRFTAEFIGENNLLAGRVTHRDGDTVSVDLNFASVDCECGGKDVTPGMEVSLSIRSELLSLLEPGEPADDTLQSIPSTYVEAIYLGLTTSHLVKLPTGQEVSVRHISPGSGAVQFEPGQEVAVGWKLEQARLHIS